MNWFVLPDKRTYGKYKDSDSIKPRGRPRKKDRLNSNLHISDELREILEYHHKEGERYSDTLLRVYRELNHSIIELRRQLDYYQK